ncbi:DNA internalization-related competence protein ComEC/Rec2 [Dellaglioa sp. P0083]|uniref:DNA internalization-related competence protein ComEC/Rec2 n=1 Tax=Dellaglioa kimchii TaxID=3344667 RepID=UPI0038D42178
MFAIVIFIRIITLKRSITFYICCVCILIFGIYFYSNAKEIQKQVVVEKEVQDVNVKIYPDDYSINGDLVSFDGQIISNSQKIRGFYSCKSQNELNKIKRNKQTKIINVDAKLQKIKSATNENEFDYQSFMRTKSIYNSMTIIKVNNSEKNVINLSLESVISKLHELRAELKNYFNSLSSPLDKFLNALVIGDKTQEFNQDLASIRQLGLIHLFCLSGLHVYYFVMLIRTLGNRLLIPRETVAKGLLFLLPCYLVIAGESSSLRRAIFMCMVQLICELIDKPVQGITVWCFALLIGLVIEPQVLFTFGGQLSYLMSLLLIFMENKGTFESGIWLNLFSLPFIFFNVYQWNVLSIVLSIFIIPIFEFLILPIVIFGGMVGIHFKVVMDGINTVLKTFIYFFDELARLPLTITFGKPSLNMCVLFFICTLTCFLHPSCIKRWAILVSFYVMVFLWIHFPIRQEVVFFDIGQGDSTLIRKPFNRQITLVDTGGKVHFKMDSWRTRKEYQTSGEKIITNYLLSKGISHIDYLYLTHQDADHIGNFPSILTKIDVDRMIVPSGMEQLPQFIKKIESTRPPKMVIPMTDNSKKQDAELMILHPFNQGIGKNEDSLVLFGTIGKYSYLITGDLDRAGEKKVIQKYPNLQISILKTGHHGSKTATDPIFIDQIKPKLAVISAGKNNRYGHPHQETLDTLKKYRIPFVSTAEHGMIRISKFQNYKEKLEVFNNEKS